MNVFISRNNYPAAQFVVKNNLRTLSALIAGGLSLLFMIGEAAAEVPAIPEIPPAVAASNAQLVQQRAALLQERAALKARAAANKSECQAVKEKSAADARCVESSSAISTDVDRHIQATKLFIINLDPMVVDTRNVPSGLPKGLDNAIASVYSSAPPGVSDRVRKGFQAVMERDWAVAKAWFQDALNRDPTNAGLKRLVALTDLPQQPIRQEAPVDNRNEPAGRGGKSDFKGAFATPSQTKPATVTPTDPNDMNVLLPGLKAMDKPTGTQSQRPDQNDMNVLSPDFDTMSDDQAFDYLYRLKDLETMSDDQAFDYLYRLNAKPPASESGKTK